MTKSFAEEYEDVLRRNAALAGLDEDSIQRMLNGMLPLCEAMDEFIEPVHVREDE